MKVIRNSIIPFKGFAGVNLFGILFIRKETILTKRMFTHECIHTAQMEDMYYILFYLWYAIEWLIRLVKTKNAYEAYKSISLEKEAYENDSNAFYLMRRMPYAWLKWV